MYKRIEPNKAKPPITEFQFPHCDQRILHAPKECVVCDKYPNWQMLRQAWGIAFTGYTPEGNELPCPADHARGDNHKSWSGNQARPSEPDSGEAQAKPEVGPNLNCGRLGCSILGQHYHIV